MAAQMKTGPTGLTEVQKISIGADCVTIVTAQRRYTIAADDFLDQPVAAGQSLTEGQLQTLQELDCYAAAWKRTMRKLTAGDRSVYEIKQLLGQIEGLSQAQQNKIIQRCKKAGYLDDARLIDSYLGQIGQRHLGPLKCRQALKKRGLPFELVDSKVDQIDDQVFIQAGLAAGQRCLDSLKGCSSLARRQKTAAKLYALGFDRQLSNDIISRLDYDNNAECESANLQKAYQKAYQRYSRRHDGYKLQQDIYRCLLAAGYSRSDIAAIINESRNEDD